MKPLHIAIVEGNGIGPEITVATREVLAATGLPFAWEPVAVGPAAIVRHGHPLPPESVHTLRAAGLVLKGPLIVVFVWTRIPAARRFARPARVRSKEPSRAVMASCSSAVPASSPATPGACRRPATQWVTDGWATQRPAVSPGSAGAARHRGAAITTHGLQP